MKAEWDVEYERTPNHASFSTTLSAHKVLKIDGRPIRELKDEYLEEVKQHFFDKWNWETDDPTDRQMFEELQAEWEARQALRGRTRRLTASWTIEAQTDVENLYAVDLEEELTKAMSDEILKEVAKDLEVSGDEKWLEKLKGILKQ